MPKTTCNRCKTSHYTEWGHFSNHYCLRREATKMESIKKQKLHIQKYHPYAYSALKEKKNKLAEESKLNQSYILNLEGEEVELLIRLSEIRKEQIQKEQELAELRSNYQIINDNVRTNDVQKQNLQTEINNMFTYPICDYRFVYNHENL